MNLSRIKIWSRTALFACGLLALASTGCQTTVGGQTLPSGYYLEDDVQFFPAGPEFKLSNQVQALEEYRLQQEAIDQGLNPNLP